MPTVPFMSPPTLVDIANPVITPKVTTIINQAITTNQVTTTNPVITPNLAIALSPPPSRYKKTYTAMAVGVATALVMALLIPATVFISTGPAPTPLVATPLPAVVFPPVATPVVLIIPSPNQPPVTPPNTPLNAPEQVVLPQIA